jgi:23S rRNA (adenine2503-C2)-methyltransferase
VASPYDLDREELAILLAGEPRYRVDQLFAALWDEGVAVAAATALPRALRERLMTHLVPGLEVAADVSSDQGATRRFVFRLHDGATIETVLMSYPDRVTVCVSTQAGCAMACSFCATGQAGFSRHLTRGEIVEQVITAARAVAPLRVSNVVFMGMGEPLANYDATVGAVRALTEHRRMSARNLTVSTVGVVPGIEKLAKEGLPLTLAVSLHSANDEDRTRLIPLNKRYPLARLAQACAMWVDVTGRRLSFEWALIDGVNDRPRDVAELARYAYPLRAHVNLIPLNPTPGYAVLGSPAERVREFRDELVARGVVATVRQTRGRSIDAACGQLANVTRPLRRR